MLDSADTEHPRHCTEFCWTEEGADGAEKEVLGKPLGGTVLSPWEEKSPDWE